MYLSMRSRRSVVRGRGGRSIEPIVDLLTNQVNTKGHERDSKSRSGMTELIRKHWVSPPLVPPLEELSSRSQHLIWIRHLSVVSLFTLSLFCVGCLISSIVQLTQLSNLPLGMPYFLKPIILVFNFLKLYCKFFMYF